MSSVEDPNQSIQVYVRCRPFLESEENQQDVLEIHSALNKIIVSHSPTAKTFSFDRVFGPETGQELLYEEVAAPLIQEVLMGFNCTILAYGQTGTGKTFTIDGYRTQNLEDGAKDPLPGIIPRAMKDLFHCLEKQKSKFHIGVSFLELYNEEIFDLLTKSEDLNKLKMFDTSSLKSSVVRGLEEISVTSMRDVYTILDRGCKKRHKAATLLNKMSSRSHTIFTATVEIKEESTTMKTTKTAKLNLVDLAGSENIGRSGSVEKQAREAGNINQSLLALGRVIGSLCKNAKHIPYRESKLTRLLRDSIGGQTKTAIIATISPSVHNIEETLNTLNYALRAKNIMNKPEVNAQVCPTSLSKEYLGEICKLEKTLYSLRSQNGYYVDVNNWRKMNEKKALLAGQNSQILSEIEEVMKESASLDIEISQAEHEIAAETKKLEEKRKKREKTVQEIQNEKEERASSERMLAILERYSRDLHVQFHKDLVNYSEIQAEHKKVKQELSQSMKERQFLSEKLQNLQSTRSRNVEFLKGFKEGILKDAKEFQENVSSRTAECETTLSSLQELLGEYCSSLEKGFTDISSLITNLEKENASFSESLISLLEEKESSKLEWINTIRETHSCNTLNIVDFDSFEDLLNGCEKNLTVIFISLKDWKESLSSKIKEQQKFLNANLKDQINLTETLTKKLGDWIKDLNEAFAGYGAIVSENQNRDATNMNWEEHINSAENAICSLEMFCNENMEEEFGKHLLAHLKLEDFMNIFSKASSNMQEFCDSSIKAFNEFQDKLKSKNLTDIFPVEVQKHTATAFTNYHNLNIGSTRLAIVPKNSEELDDIPKLIDDEEFHAQDMSIMAYCEKLLKQKESYGETLKNLRIKMESLTSEEVTLLEKLRKASGHCYEHLMSFLSKHMETDPAKIIEPLASSKDRHAPGLVDSNHEEGLQTPPSLRLALTGNDLMCEKMCPFCQTSFGSEQFVGGACSMNFATSKSDETFSQPSTELMSFSLGKKALLSALETQRNIGRRGKESRKQQRVCVEDEILNLLMMKEGSSDDEK